MWGKKNKGRSFWCHMESYQGLKAYSSFVTIIIWAMLKHIFFWIFWTPEQTWSWVWLQNSFRKLCDCYPKNLETTKGASRGLIFEWNKYLIQWLCFFKECQLFKSCVVKIYLCCLLSPDHIFTMSSINDRRSSLMYIY